jgi:hypothetical protein
MKIIILSLIFLLLSGFCLVSASELSDYNAVKCVMHLHTNISSGLKTIETYAKEAREENIDVVVLTDQDWIRWEYGLPPFRRLFKKVVQKDSLMTFGIDKYLRAIRESNEKYDDLIIIDGIQTNPFYYWSGNFLKGTLILNNRNKDMLVIGFDDANDYINMPLVTTHKSKFDAYHGDKFTRPYQDLIDYTIKQDGLIFWSHPEFEENTMIDGVRLITAPYQWDLVGTYDYTGFGIFWEGYNKIGKPLGIWDRTLTEYCQGKRDSPVWAIGELEDEGDKNLDFIVNVLYIKDFNRENVLDALRRGRFYAEFNLSGKTALVLEDFSVCDETGVNTATMGEEASFSGDPVINIKVLQKQPAAGDINVKLIRNNKIIEEFSGKTQLEIEYKDSGLAENQKYYYRVDIISGSQIVANPIFFNKISK